ncbi:hypothetical protein MTO96_004352 [Rhipicephalus appendiculatus]
MGAAVHFWYAAQGAQKAPFLFTHRVGFCRVAVLQGQSPEGFWNLPGGKMSRALRLILRGQPGALPDGALREQAWRMGGVVAHDLVGGDPCCRRGRQIPTKEMTAAFS